jgi:hypothetical protein
MCIKQKAAYLFFKFCFDGIGCLQPLLQLILCLWCLKLVQASSGCSDSSVILAKPLYELAQLLLSDHLLVSFAQVIATGRILRPPLSPCG